MDERDEPLNRKDVKIINEQVAYQGFFQIKKITFKHRLFSGEWSETLTRELFCRGDSVAILLYDPNRDEVALTLQFRVGAIKENVTSWLYEIVAGMVEKNETSMEVAVRETQEEAGYAIQECIPICHYYSSPGGSSEKIQLFCAKVDSKKLGGVHGSIKENENIKIETMPREKAYRMIEEGKIINAATIIALQWLELHKDSVF